MPSSVTLLAVGRWPATEKPAVLVSPPPIASTPGASVATVFRSDASVGSWREPPVSRDVTSTVAPPSGWLSGPVTVPTMMSVVAPTWLDAVRGTGSASRASRTSGPTRASGGVTLWSRRRAADRKARLGRGPRRDGDDLGVGARKAAVAGHAGERQRVVAGGNPARCDAIVRADRCRVAGDQNHGVAGRKVRPGGGRRDGETARRRGAVDREGGSRCAAGRYGDGLRVGT